MRIISGTARGQRLDAPGHGTRPTSDRGRESLFSSLTHALAVRGHDGFAGIDVLDVFCGSGALGLEAVSRGARRAYLVDRNRAACMVARQNSSRTRLAADVFCRDAVAMFKAGRLATDLPAFGVVFMDPPYAMPPDQVSAIVASLVAGDWLADGAVVVVERPVSDGGFEWPDGLVETATSTVGDTAFHWGFWYVQ